MARGRPSDYTSELAEAICQRVAMGESLRQIERDEDMPAKWTVLRWLNLHAEFSAQYTRAKAAQADVLAEELLEIADDGTNDWQQRELAGGAIVSVPDHEHITRSKLRVDTRKWLMGKLAAKKYGAALDLKHSGGVRVNVFRDD